MSKFVLAGQSIFLFEFIPFSFMMAAQADGNTGGRRGERNRG